MRKIKDGWYVLDAIEFGALVDASIGQARKELHKKWYDPKENGLPAIVDEAYEMLYGVHLYTGEQLAGSLVVSEDGKLVEDSELYQTVSHAFNGCAVEVHAIYQPDNNFMPGWFLAAVDLFKSGRTYRVYFSNVGNGKIQIEDISRWRFG